MELKPEYRLSKQRKVILEELQKVDTHPTAEEVYEMARRILPRISLGTVYRNLEFLCAQGLILKLGAPGEQKRFDGNPEPHCHVRCLVCSRVADIPVALEAPRIPKGADCGFDIQGCNIEYVGLCPACQNIEP